MKSRLCIFFYFILFTHNLYGQEIKFRHFSEPYIYLDDEYPITQKIRWRDDQSLTARLPFEIRFGDIGNHILDIHTNGYCSIFDTVRNINFMVLGLSYFDLIDRSF